MNASGIQLADDLRQAWASLAPTVRFLVLAIRNESIVLDSTADIHGDLDADLPALQDLLHDTVPAYVLARLDADPTTFLAVTYVPDAASVRDKMLYASSRTALTKSLGAAAFPDALFATSKADLTPAAYAAHRRHVAAPQPLSAAECDRAVAERASAGTASLSPLANARIQLRASDAVAPALAALASADESTLVVLSIDPATESLIFVSSASCAPSDVGAALPPAEPSYAFFEWIQPDRRDTLFIYSCPSASPVKHRMLFSASAAIAVATAATVLPSPPTKRIEASDPLDLDEAYLRASLGTTSTSTAAGTDDAARPFAKPRGPARKQR